MTDDRKPAARKGQTLDERARIFEEEILNAFTVKRQTGLADGAGAPGSTAAGNQRSGIPEADSDRGTRH
jgi:hypothetical protein